MTDRDRLIELIIKGYTEWGNITRYEVSISEYLADYLLENGVIVPLCKVGDMVYAIGTITGQIIESVVIAIICSENNIFLHLENETVVDIFQQLGKTVFLTKEEAEEKLKELGK